MINVNKAYTTVYIPVPKKKFINKYLPSKESLSEFMVNASIEKIERDNNVVFDK